MILFPLVLVAAASPPAASVAVFPLEAKLGVTQAMADLVTEHLLGALRRTKAFDRVVSPADISVQMPREARETLQRCASDECSLVDEEMAGALGVTYILVGNVGRLGDSYLLNLRLIHLRTALVVGRVADRARGVAEDALLDALQPAAADLVAQAHLGPAAPVAARPPQPTSTKGGLRKILWGVGGLVLAGTGVLVVGGVALWSLAAGLLAYDVANGWRPGGLHALTATQALVGNLVLGTAAITTVLAITAALTGGTVLVASGLTS